MVGLGAGLPRAAGWGWGEQAGCTALGGKKGICASVWESLGCGGTWTKRNVLFLLHKGLPLCKFTCSG